MVEEEVALAGWLVLALSLNGQRNDDDDEDEEEEKWNKDVISGLNSLILSLDASCQAAGEDEPDELKKRVRRIETWNKEFYLLKWLLS